LCSNPFIVGEETDGDEVAKSHVPEREKKDDESKVITGRKAVSARTRSRMTNRTRRGGEERHCRDQDH
jgi:hypothetical protein